MHAADGLAILAAGVGAGAINGVVGSGTLITFPVLLTVGYAPVTANVSNTVGLVPGTLASAVAYRRELQGQRHRAVRYAVASVLGGIAGAVLLLVLPASAFRAIVPCLIAISLVLIVAQPWLARRLRARQGTSSPEGGRLTFLAVCASGVYGGYFGAAQGILLLAILGIGVRDDLQRLNALKVVLAMLVNLVAGVFFCLLGRVALLPALLIAVGSVVGGHLGARYGRRLPTWVLRTVIVVVGVLAIVRVLA